MAVRVFNIDIDSFKAAGAVTALADGALEAVTGAYIEMLGKAPSFEAYESARLAWRQGYAEQKGEGVKASALDQAWKRFKDACGIDVPKSASPEATKKAEQRANPYADKPKAEIQEAIKSLTGDDMETAKAKVKAMEALAKVEKAEAKEAEKVAKEATTKRVKALTDYIKAAKPEALAFFECVMDLTADNVSEPARAHAWMVLSHLQPMVDKAPSKAKKAA